MNILNLEHITKVLGAKTILNDISAGVSDTDKIGIVGINGAGKSTLLRIAAGVMEPDEGNVVRTSSLKISYLPQNPDFDDSCSLMENVTKMVCGKAAHWNTEGEVRSMLLKFGIPDPDCSPKILSGGQKKRAALVAALLTPSNLLILDEPTNHLDIEMVIWLQDFLTKYKGAILMVTHDRYFLDEVTDSILEIDGSSAYRYDESYAGYLALRQQRLDYAIAAERKMAALYKKDLAWIMRGARARSTKQKAHIQRFEELRDRDRIAEERRVEISSLSTRIGGKTIELSDISKGYGGRILFRNFSYNFLKTDRIGIIGPNGCGKSTLLKLILGLTEPDTGTIEIGQTIRFGYFSQENEQLDESMRVLEYIRDTAEYIRTKDGTISASVMCEKFLFDPKMQYTPISKLSGGEKRRLYLLRVLMEQPNVLILDEPTNDLDIETLQILEDYLDTFPGIIIAVSHDRYFLDRVVTRVFAFREDGTLFQSEGGYEEYCEHAAELGIAAIRETIGQNPEKKADDKRTAQETAAKTRTKLSYKDQKEYDTIEAEIDSLTEKAERLAKAIDENASDYGKLKELFQEKEETERKIEERMERYIELQDMVDEFAKNK